MFVFKLDSPKYYALKGLKNKVREYQSLVFENFEEKEEDFIKTEDVETT